MLTIDAVDDCRLMGEVSAGSVEAFGELYDRFCDRAYGVALSVCRDEGHAQDAVQEAFLALWKARTGYCAERGSVAAWLLTVVRYRAIDAARRDGRYATHWASEDGLEDYAAHDDISAIVIQRDAAERLKARLAQLPDSQQQAITLAYYSRLSHTQIAARLAIPTGTAKGRIRLGLQKLRTDIESVA